MKPLPRGVEPGFCDRPVSAWAAEWAALAPVDHVRRALRAVYAGEPAWELPGLRRGLRCALEALRPALPTPPVCAERSAADGTRKLLLDLDPGRVETVLIPEARSAYSRAHQQAVGPAASRALERRPPRASGCVSTQVGCGVGCVFCASGLDGLVRNLTPGQIVAQAVHLRRLARADGLYLGNVVLMGMGEPFHNTDHVLVALENLTHPDALAIGVNHVAVSTVGVAEGIERLAREGPAVNLVLSLHAACDATRQAIVPLAKRLPPVEELCRLAGWYARETKRRATISYVLLRGVNDDLAQARELARLATTHGVTHVNLIPWNPVEGLAYAAPARAAQDAFFGVLREAGVPVHVRRTRGADADAACGQLRLAQA